MGNQPAWQRYSRLQGQLMAQAADRTFGDRGAEVLARWAAEGDGLDGPGDIPPGPRAHVETSGGDRQYAGKVSKARAMRAHAAGRQRTSQDSAGSRQPITVTGPEGTTVVPTADEALALVRAQAAGRVVTPPAAPAAADGTPQVGRRFVLGGNAILTLQGTSSRYTFRVQQGKPREGDSPDRSQPYFLQLLTGPDNTSEYTYVGIVDQATGRVRLTRASRYTQESAPVKAWDWVMSRVFAGKDHAPAQIHHAGRCGRCARLLTVPASILSGFGPECLGKLGE